MNDVEHRFPVIDLATATPAQKQIADEIMSGPRKGLFGPFLPLVHAPALAAKLHKVGEYLRYESTLPKDILECAIITVATRWKSPFEWNHHAPLALAAGVPPDVVQAISDNAKTESFPDKYRLIVSLCRDAMNDGRINDHDFAQARSAYGREGVLELLTVCGYYSTLAMILATADIT